MTRVDITWYATDAASMLFTFGLAPTLLFLRVRKKKPEERKWMLWVPVSVVLTWAYLIAFSVVAEAPALQAFARQRGDFDADGVGGNVAVLVAGWIIPLLGCLLFAPVFTVIDRRKIRNRFRSDVRH